MRFAGILKKLILLALIPVAVFCLFVLLPINLITKDYIYSDVNSLPRKQAIIVLGAKVYDNRHLSAMLQDRVDSAVELFLKDKSQRILVSGDHGHVAYDEVNTIKRYLLEKNVPAENIFLDHAGFDTYDSLYRAHAIFGIENAVVVSQGFHLPRAVYIGRWLGVDTYGFIADRQKYAGGTFFNSVREVIADIKAVFDVSFGVKPRFLGDAIPIGGDSRRSWD